MIIYYKSAGKEFDDKHKSSLKYLQGSNSLYMTFDLLAKDEELTDIRIELPSQAELSFYAIKFYSSENQYLLFVS